MGHIAKAKICRPTHSFTQKSKHFAAAPLKKHHLFNTTVTLSSVNNNINEAY